MTFSDDTNELVRRYWVDSPDAFQHRMNEMTENRQDRIQSFEICRNNLGQPVPGFRMGRGSRHVFLIGREHGHEPVGTCGLAALMDGLDKATIPGTDTHFSPANEILRSFTLHIYPMMNPDGAQRFSRQVSQSFPASQFKYSQDDSDEYRAIHSEPGVTLSNDRPPHFTPQEMAAWRATRKPIGSLFTEDGVELWMDWQHEKAPQTRAVKKLMSESRPSLFVDIHAMEGLTAIFSPPGLTESERGLYWRIGRGLYDALERASIPFDPSRELRSSGVWRSMTSIQWVRNTFGATVLLYEVDNGYRWYDPALKPEQVVLPTISKAQIILAAWYGVIAILQGFLESTNRK